MKWNEIKWNKFLGNEHWTKWMVNTWLDGYSLDNVLDMPMQCAWINGCLLCRLHFLLSTPLLFLCVSLLLAVLFISFIFGHDYVFSAWELFSFVPINFILWINFILNCFPLFKQRIYLYTYLCNAYNNDNGQNCPHSRCLWNFCQNKNKHSLRLDRLEAINFLCKLCISLMAHLPNLHALFFSITSFQCDYFTIWFTWMLLNRAAIIRLVRNFLKLFDRCQVNSFTLKRNKLNLIYSMQLFDLETSKISFSRLDYYYPMQSIV